MCRSIRAAHFRYRALTRIDGARAPNTAPEPHARAVLLAHSSTRPGSASKSNSPSRVSFANPPARTSLNPVRVTGGEADRDWAAEQGQVRKPKAFARRRAIRQARPPPVK